MDGGGGWMDGWMSGWMRWLIFVKFKDRSESIKNILLYNKLTLCSPWVSLPCVLQLSDIALPFVVIFVGLFEYMG